MKRPLTNAEALRRLRAACEGAGGQAAWAKRHGVLNTQLCEILAGKKPITARFLKPLGLEAEVIYREASDGAL
jgi:hypothetical protein